MTLDRAALRAALPGWLHAIAHHLPAQAPLRDFVHHNTLHALEHLPFPAALATAHALTGARPYWPDARFRAAWADGRITAADLDAALDEAGLKALEGEILPGLRRRRVLRAVLCAAPVPEAARRAWLVREGGLADPARLARCLALCPPVPAPASPWRDAARRDWAALCDGVGQQYTWGGILAHLSGRDFMAHVGATLRRLLAAHLDQGVAAWPLPGRAAGFYAAWRASARLDLAWDLDDHPGARHDIADLPADAETALLDGLLALLPDTTRWPGYLERLAQESPGWAGMFARQEALADYLAVRVTLERLLVDWHLAQLAGTRLALADLPGHFADRPGEFFLRHALHGGRLDDGQRHQALGALQRQPVDEAACARLAEAFAAPAGADDDTAAWQLYVLLDALPEIDPSRVDPATAQRLLAEAATLTPLQRGHLWLLAYERHYREQIFAALAAQAGPAGPTARPAAQAIFCMDDREEGTRRHLEEIAPAVQTFGAAGFFGIAMYWQGVDDAGPSALCPVVVTPAHQVQEVAADSGAAARHAARRDARLSWRDRFVHGSRRSLFGAPFLAALGAVPALAGVLGRSLVPAGFGTALQRWQSRFEGQLATRPAITREHAEPQRRPAEGFSTDEQVSRIAALLRVLGLTGQFAPLVVLVGHGSDSRNNPHAAAYDCGACAGKHGGPNARVFAAMANRPEVRAGLAAQGIAIGPETWFVAGQHNTCDDSMVWYDLDALPASHTAAFDDFAVQLAQACRAHAAERCRRLASAPADASPQAGEHAVRQRRHDPSQARPELGHATNAAALIGRRSMSRGLFLDRRVFLVSYDPTQDADGALVESLLLAVGPVGAGISLEYYFSTVDNARFGCGSKVTHNITGLAAVMDGTDSDLRTGLPWQMVEIHEPMRLLVIVEQETAVLDAILARQPALQRLVGNGWIQFAARHPESGALHRLRPGHGWQAWTGHRTLPQAAHSLDWTRGQREPLPPARILAGQARRTSPPEAAA